MAPKIHNIVGPLQIKERGEKLIIFPSYFSAGFFFRHARCAEFFK